MDSPVKVGLVGCGAIAPAYLKNLTSNLSRGVEVVACSDLNREAAEKLAGEFEVPNVYSTDDLLGDSNIELALNLTPAPIHYEVSRKILEAGKHLFTEKPLCLELDKGADLLERAKCRSLKVGGAADTFLGAGLQVARRFMEDGRIGDAIAANTIVTVPLRQDRRYHEVFRGAVFDLGPYYVTALVHLFGSVKRVVSLSPIRYPEKKDAGTGETFKLDLPSTASAVLEFENGVTSTFLASQDVHSYFPRIEVLGTKGRLVLNDANFYTGTVEIDNYTDPEVVDPKENDGYVHKQRGLGVAEMAYALRHGREPRASGELMYHVLEVLQSVFTASGCGSCVEIQSQVEKPALWKKGELENIRSN